MGKVAVITGATSGIGLETARLLSGRGYTVYSISRGAGGLPGVTYLRADVTSEEEIRAAFDVISGAAAGIDLLINNAGYGVSGACEFTAPDDAARQLEVNFLGALRCLRFALPLMRGRGGRVINVSSMAAVFPVPFHALYSASKAALNALSLALGNELAPHGVSVCAVMPGDVRTPFAASRRKNAEDGVYARVAGRAVAVMERDEEHGASAARTAERIVKIALGKRVRPLYALGAGYKTLYFLARFLPANLVCRILRKIYCGVF
ncbi:MAG: SDR family NAD(P)-dependent oxidoreductase [Oscillospiraceae bacterium]|jgi:NAD(P)-dependent dehydrogenase (short-subunit alcohol dehydrogenase family)|nr:SDR family NAD(P)-dependent oxidoreductase [Oscillospiraceae bacterium]